VARAAGYVATGECVEDPKYGGMGIHYASQELIADGELDVTKPEILVYQPTPGGRLRLGAIEYFQVDGDQDLATDDDRPELFGMPFDGPMLGHEPGMPVHYDLHVWLYRHNPAGLFAGGDAPAGAAASPRPSRPSRSRAGRRSGRRRARRRSRRRAARRGRPRPPRRSP
jgi:hypothetical protein